MSTISQRQPTALEPGFIARREEYLDRQQMLIARRHRQLARRPHYAPAVYVRPKDRLPGSEPPPRILPRFSLGNAKTPDARVDLYLALAAIKPNALRDGRQGITTPLERASMEAGIMEPRHPDFIEVDEEAERVRKINRALHEARVRFTQANPNPRHLPGRRRPANLRQAMRDWAAGFARAVNEAREALGVDPIEA